MNPAMAAAFKSGAGWEASYIALGIVLIVGAFAMVWCANAIRGLAAAWINKAPGMDLLKLKRYSIRAVILAMLLIYLLS